MSIFDIFSKRDKPLPDVFQTESIPKKLRTQICWIWKDSLFKLAEGTLDWEPRNPVMREIVDVICREHGLPFLYERRSPPEEDLVNALCEHKDTKIVLDIIEVSFRYISRADQYDFRHKRDDVIRELNHRFRENGVGYQFDTDAQRLIPIDSLITHQEIVRPALKLLAGPQYASANQEYLEAFDDYKKADYDDCLTKCCSCFESVMKVVCDAKGWPYQQGDTARPLLTKIIDNTDLPSFFDQPLLLIATLRNRLSSSHGSGTSQQHVPEHLARYALHATASAILLIAEAAK